MKILELSAPDANGKTTVVERDATFTEVLSVSVPTRDTATSLTRAGFYLVMGVLIGRALS